MIKERAILLVEDDPNDVFLVKRAFKKANITNPIQVADNGKKAVQYLETQETYNDREKHPLHVLILMDLKLPRMSGFELLEWLQKQPVLKCIPVVVLTSSRESVDIDKAYDLGANSYLIKPVDFDGLLELVNMLSKYWLTLNINPK